MMAQNSALGALGERRAGHPTGFRRLTPGLLAAERTAARFDGLPDGVTAPGQLLAALKAAAPRLGLTPRLVHAIDWLFRFTQPQDWGRGRRPVVWPSAAMQQEALGLSLTRTKALNRALIEAGLITMRDSPNGKRYGKRDGTGKIIEAHGFDLSPLAARYAEFVRLAEEARAERAEMGRLRRRATIARNGIAQILETAAEYGFAGEEGDQLAGESRRLTRALRTIEQPEEMAFAVEGLERRQRAARARLEQRLAEASMATPESVIPAPMGAESGPHSYTYKPSPDPDQDTVVAQETGNGLDRSDSPPDPTTLPWGRAEQGRVFKLLPDELVRLAPRLKPYLRRSDPTWSEIVDAADWLRHELDVSKPLWGEACLTLGREPAAIALAIVSTKQRATSGPRPAAISMAWWRRRSRDSSISTGPSGRCAGPQNRAQRGRRRGKEAAPGCHPRPDHAAADHGIEPDGQAAASRAGAVGCTGPALIHCRHNVVRDRYDSPSFLPVHPAGTRSDPSRAGGAVWPVPNLANGLCLRTWRSGPQKGEPKIPAAIQSMLDRGLVEIRPNPMGRQAAFFTEAGLEGLRQLLRDPRAVDPERFVHLRRELGVDAAGDA